MAYYKDEDSSKLPAWVVLEDIRKRNAKNADNFTPAQKQAAADFEARARSAYIRSRVFLNNREKFIAVKIDRPSVSDKISTQVKELDRFAELHNIKIVRTKANIVYHIA